MNQSYYVGVEGGASVSKAVLIDETGKELAWVDGPSTNYWLIGEEESHKRISELVMKAKAAAELEPTVEVAAIGLSLSGCEIETDNIVFARKLLERYPLLTKQCFVSSDTIGSVMTASPNGGAVLIAGTGSNSLLLNPNGQVFKCGGWGHLLGDEGSAYWISSKAIQTLIKHDDNFIKCAHDVEPFRRVMHEHFKIKDTLGLLAPAYHSFDKTQFAGLCAKIATLANSGDGLSIHIFSEAGFDMGRHVASWAEKIDESLYSSKEGLKVVCVGSVFKSWPLLKNAFYSAIGGRVKRMTLVRLEKSAALGAAFMAIHRSGSQIKVNHSDYYQVMCSYYSADS
ncbi:N-acetyl-D-glucosamine kinase [Halotydeus destructor]|nr:N-acetyl-D-glucosamine kinase [Halotydeus destructor]